MSKTTYTAIEYNNKNICLSLFQDSKVHYNILVNDEAVMVTTVRWSEFKVSDTLNYLITVLMYLKQAHALEASGCQSALDKLSLEDQCVSDASFMLEDKKYMYLY